MFSHLKRRIGVLTAVAVLAALVPTLAVSTASAAVAATATAPGDTTRLSACPSTATIASAGFTDTTSTDVDCVAMYGITTGVTATTYEPSANIPRWQMALYLTRTMDVANVTLGSGADQGFTDISGYSAAIQTAINQIKQAGVTTGTTATTFSPDDNVTNEQMAMFVERMLDTISAGPEGQQDGTATTINGTTGTAYNYTDIDTGVTFEGHNAIVEMYNLGIPGDDKTVTTFAPTAAMTRATMATWLTNVLAHSNVRPAGLVIQATDVADFGDMEATAAGLADALHVSHRDASFDPIVNSYVDIFGYIDESATKTGDAAFTSAGVCKNTNAAVGGAEGACTIEVSDDITDSTGNVSMNIQAMHANIDVTNGLSAQYWAWTGAVAATYADGTSTSATTTVTSTKIATHVTAISSRLRAAEAAVVAGALDLDALDTDNEDATKIRMGETTTVTFQAESDASGTDVSMAGLVLTVLDHRGTQAANTRTSITSTTLTTDANGQASYDVTVADPTSGNDTNTWVALKVSVLVPDKDDHVADVAGAFNGHADSNGTAWLFYQADDDETRAVTTVTNVADDIYVTATAAGSGATSSVTATLYDQYGATVANTNVAFTTAGSAESDGAANLSFTGTINRTSNSSGVATLALTRDSATTTAETITATSTAAGTDTIYWVESPSATALAAAITEAGGATISTAALVMTGDAEAFAATAAPTSDKVQAAIVIADKANDKMVVEINYDDNVTAEIRTFVVYSYDSDDNFLDISAGPMTYAEWDTMLGTTCPLIVCAAGVDLLTGTFISATNASLFQQP